MSKCAAQCVQKGIEGALYKNLSLKELVQKLREEKGEVYAYVLTTIKYENGEFIQTGSAPNFQGGLITLCTCKRFMRTWKPVQEWKGVWIAGFTSTQITSTRKNYLFYLMKVSNAYPSFKSLWERVYGKVYQKK